MTICEKEEIQDLIERLKTCESLYDRLEILNSDVRVISFLEEAPELRTFLTGLNPECDYAIKAVLVIEQGQRIFDMQGTQEDRFENLRTLLMHLLYVERAYREIGGILGYHAQFCRLCKEKEHIQEKTVKYEQAPFYDLRKTDLEQRQAILEGIRSLPEMAELYAVGGAGDRLGLTDELTGIPLPAAKLNFGGVTLLESLIKDLQGREYLHYKLYGKQVITPIAMMTSLEKNNHEHIQKICEENNWFGRPKDHFIFFTQQSVPVINDQGDWVMKGPLKLQLKPGGHGVLWGLAEEEGVFKALESMGKQHLLIRQVNNPLAGTDTTLLAFAGTGIIHQKTFGLAACQRPVGSAQGVDVLKVIEKNPDENEYIVTNIEYTDFAKAGIQEQAVTEGSPYSEFPANTNLLFANISAIRPYVKQSPLPGMLINLKQKSSKGDRAEGRLESTMQNIADVITYPGSHRPSKEDLETYVTYSDVKKTLSATKKLLSNTSLDTSDTPEEALYSQQNNHHTLFTKHCKFDLPPLSPLARFISEPILPFFISYHPALGPLYSVIAQKIRAGSLSFGSELHLGLTELYANHLHINGSVIIEASSPLGDGSYSESSGKCVLKNVTIDNLGIDYSIKQCFWKHQIQRTESLHIILNGNGEFYAEDITIRGKHRIEVPDGWMYTAYTDQGQLFIRQQKIDQTSWYWNYSVNDKQEIDLEPVITASTIPLGKEPLCRL